MTAIDFILNLVVGRLFVWLIMTNGITKLVKEKTGGTIAELLSCDLCLSFWVYLGLAVVVGGLGLFDNVIFDAVAFAAIAAFVSHVFSLGFSAKFVPVVYD